MLLEESACMEVIDTVRRTLELYFGLGDETVSTLAMVWGPHELQVFPALDGGLGDVTIRFVLWSDGSGYSHAQGLNGVERRPYGSGALNAEVITAAVIEFMAAYEVARGGGSEWTPP